VPGLPRGSCLLDARQLHFGSGVENAYLRVPLSQVARALLWSMWVQTLAGSPGTPPVK